MTRMNCGNSELYDLADVVRNIRFGLYILEQK